MKRIALAWVLFCCAPALAGGPVWRQASINELRQIIPARAPVGKERIETEFRAASGITDGRRFIAGVFMIVTGYEADRVITIEDGRIVREEEPAAYRPNIGNSVLSSSPLG